MVRFPHTLEIWHEEAAALNPDGSWTRGAHAWRPAGRCCARRIGRTLEVTGRDGRVSRCTFEVALPAGTKPIAPGTPVRIFDRRGFNIFDCAPCTGGEPAADCSSSASVLGFYPGGQRHETATLLL